MIKERSAWDQDMAVKAAVFHIGEGTTWQLNCPLLTTSICPMQANLSLPFHHRYCLLFWGGSKMTTLTPTALRAFSRSMLSILSKGLAIQVVSNASDMFVW